MTGERAPPLGRGALLAAGGIASLLPFGAQFLFAASAILFLGLAHGASDLAVVTPRRRPSFLAAYGVAIGATLIWWLLAPAGALVFFLVLSSVHFGLDDAPVDRPGERLCRGVLMIAGPAVFHRQDLAALFVALTDQPQFGADLAATLAIAGAATAAFLPSLVAAHVRNGDRDGGVMLAIGGVALLALPPLVGFTLAFILLHARPQTVARMRTLGCVDLRAYAVRVAPVLGAAFIVVAGAAALFLQSRSPSLTTLFGGLAALAVPHMVVTPWWRTSRYAPRPAVARFVRLPHAKQG